MSPQFINVHRVLFHDNTEFRSPPVRARIQLKCANPTKTKPNSTTSAQASQHTDHSSWPHHPAILLSIYHNRPSTSRGRGGLPTKVQRNVRLLLRASLLIWDGYPMNGVHGREGAPRLTSLTRTSNSAAVVDNDVVTCK